MKFGVSNIAWAPSVNDEALALLPEFGIRGLEIAPTKIAGWDDLSAATLGAYRRRCEDAGLEISSLQAILFDRPEAKLLGDGPAFSEMIRHVERVAAIADELGAHVAVFGAPNNRRLEGMPHGDAWRLGIDRFRRLGDTAGARNLSLGIEPLPIAYGGEFLTNAADVVALVEEVGHPFVRTHLDTACVALAGDSIGQVVATASSTLVHFHVSEPQLEPVTSASSNHMEAASALKAIDYGGWIALEMRDAQERWRETLIAAMKTMVSVYAT